MADFPPAIGSTMTAPFILNVAMGNVPGHSMISLIGRNPTVGTIFEDYWGPSTAYVKPTAEETWEIVSSSANDTSAGTGARTVFIPYLDDDYIERISIVAMNGTTPVTINTDHFRPQSSMLVLTVGSLGANAGTITLRVASAGAVRSEIPFGDVGFSVAQDLHHTIPAGKTGFGVQIVPFFPKNEDGFARIVLQTSGGPMFIGAELPFYQAGTPLQVVAPFAIPEKTDIVFQAKTTNGNTPLVLSFDMIVVDSDLVGKAL